MSDNQPTDIDAQQEQFFNDTHRFLEGLGLLNEADEDANLQLIALVNQNAFVVTGNWLIQLIEDLENEAAQQEMVAKMDLFGQEMVRNINVQTTDEHRYILFIAHQTLPDHQFKMLFTIGLAMMKYIGAALEKNTIDIDDQEAYIAFSNKTVLELAGKCRARLEDAGNFDKYREQLTVQLFFDSLLFEISEQAKIAGLEIF
jgi:hypothetical protein